MWACEDPFTASKVLIRRICTSPESTVTTFDKSTLCDQSFATNESKRLSMLTGASDPPRQIFRRTIRNTKKRDAGVRPLPHPQDTV